MNPTEHTDNSDNAGFSMPKGYFASSAAALQNRMEWLDEHKAFPALKMAWRESVFVTPQGYFEKAGIHTELLPYQNLQAQHGKTAFVMPEDIELNASAIRLENYKNKNTFDVPALYFEKTADKLKGLQSPVKEAKVISLRLRRFSFAAAAALLISTGWWAFNYFNQPIEAPDCGGIACVDRNEVLQVKNLDLLDDEELLDVVNASALEKALQKNENKVVNSDTAISEDDVLDAL